jgi:N-methylhydantoinase B
VPTFSGSFDSRRIAIWLTVLGAAQYRGARPHPGQYRADPADHHHGPKGCLANRPSLPQPSPASARANQLADTVMKALSRATSGECLGRHQQLEAHRLLGPQGREALGAYRDLRGLPWRTAGQGWHGCRRHALYSDTHNNPIEDIETHLPLRALLRAARGRGRRRQVARRLGSGSSSPSRARAAALVEGEGMAMGLFRRRRRHASKARSSGQLHHARAALEGAALNIAKDGQFVCYGPPGCGYGDPRERDPEGDR